VEPVVAAGAGVETPEGDVDAGTPVVDLALDVGVRAAELVEDGSGQRDALRPALSRRADADDALRAVRLDRVQHLVRDLRVRLVPGDLLPFALAALAGTAQRVKNTLTPGEQAAP